MAEGKLNINAPLMSVRRSTATSQSLAESKKKILAKRNTLASCYKSDMATDQMTETLAVPFNWERIPGRCKGNTGSEHQQLPPKDYSITPIPRLPPGKSIKSMEKEKETKAANKSKSFSVEIERKTEKKVENNRRSNVHDEEYEYDDVYSDALETLSHTESFSMNCSVSGVSGLDNFDAKKFGTISIDQQTRDFMMSRFLPAAKAMTLQPSQYSSKKQSVVLLEQQPRDVNKLIQTAKKPIVNSPTTDIVPYTGQCQEEESEDEDVAGEDYDNSASISAKGCGLLPNLHIRNSLCLLNPVAGMKMKNQITLPSAREVVKPPNKSSHIRSFSPVPAVKKAWEAIHKNKSSSGSASPEMQDGRKKRSSESNRFGYSGELLPGRLSPFQRSRAVAAGVSPCRSKPQSPFRGAKLLGDSKEAAENDKSGNLKFYSSTGLGKIQGVPFQGAKRSAYSGNLAIEKTLYIDTVNSTVKPSSSNLGSVDNSKKRIDTVIADLDKRRGKESNFSIESSHNEKHVPALEENATLDSQVLSSIGGNSSTLSGMLHLIAKEYEDEALTSDQLQGTIDEDSENNNNKQIVLSESAVPPLPPPLPKSPSESWLWRAMPIASVKNSFLHSKQGTKSNAKRHDAIANTTSSNVKWETIVKTSNLHHDHVRYSQELTMGKSQYSKS